MPRWSRLPWLPRLFPWLPRLFPWCCDRQKGRLKHQYAQCSELGFLECVRQVPRQKCHSVAPISKGTKPSQGTMEVKNWALVAHNDDVSMFTANIWIYKKRDAHPNFTENKLDDGTEKKLNFGSLDIINHITIFPGTVALKAKTTFTCTDTY